LPANNNIDLSHLERDRFQVPANLMQSFARALTDPGLIESIRANEQEPEEPLKWGYYKVPADAVTLAENIRAFNFDHVVQVGLSILSQGQLQPCIAEPISEDGQITGVRVVAGQHRAIGINFMNQLLSASGINGEMDITLRLANRSLSQKEKLEIQIAENLQNPMSPDEEAEAIAQLWYEFRAVHGDRASKADLARAIGRNSAKVYNALNYVELPLEVKSLVASRTLPYGTALDLSRMQRERSQKIEPDDAESLLNLNSDLTRTAVHIIARGLDVVAAKKYINALLDPQAQVQLGLFSGEQLMALEQENLKLGIRNAVDRAFRDAVSYFLRLNTILSKAEGSDKVLMTDALIRNIVDAIVTNNEFLMIASERDPKLMEKLTLRLKRYTTQIEV
jgi:ParB-like chromosome segregation protein Spo0J